MIFVRRRLVRSVLQPLRAVQAASCARIHAQSFAFPWARSELESLISSPNVTGTAALDPANARLRGFALSRLAADEAEILTIAIDAPLRRGGVGGDLLRAHLNQVAAVGAKKIFLEVAAGNASALALYKHFQFVQVGERKGYYVQQDGEPAMALVMRRDLT
jgi:ribosomal-protein-alanine N-acetyltransferase